ncbi:hypothetical protein FVI60_08915 [Campylobacter jejuni]|nr:hypothetical protein [Campylobacter jejuni]
MAIDYEEKKRSLANFNAIVSRDYERMDGYYHIPLTPEGRMIALAIQIIRDVPKEDLIFHSVSEPGKLYDADGYRIKKNIAYSRIEEEKLNGDI